MLKNLRNADKTQIFIFLLTIIALIELGDVVRHGYLIDFIGRSLWTSAFMIAQGEAIYTTPEHHQITSMAYTPGFVLLQAFFMKLLGFGRVIWNFGWTSASFLYVVFFTWYFSRRQAFLALMIPASALACLFPFLWARADMWSILFLGIGAIALKWSDKTSFKNYFLSALLFALAVFLKQTMLPVALGLLLARALFDEVHWLQLSFFIFSSFALLCFIGLFMAGYVFLWNEDLGQMLQVMSLGGTHHISLSSLARFSVYYLLLFGFFGFFVYQLDSKKLLSLIILFVSGLPSIAFGAKEGGGHYHFLVFVVPWLIYLDSVLRRREGDRHNFMRYFVMPWLILAGIAYFFLPLRPAPASEQDKEALTQLALLAKEIPIKGARVLFVDSLSGFSFSDPVFLEGGQPTYERAALEEYKRIPQELIEDIRLGQIDYVFKRTGDLYNSTAYGISYQPLYEALEKNMKPCLLKEGAKASLWSVLCYHK